MKKSLEVFHLAFDFVDFLWYLFIMGTKHLGIEMLSDEELNDLINYLYQIQNQ